MGVVVGECDNCGFVHGDGVDYRFPNPSVCRECGEELERTTIASQEEFERVKN